MIIVDHDEVERVGTRVYEGSFVTDVKSFPVEPWPEQGNHAAHFNLSGNRLLRAHIMAVPPGERKPTHRHVNEAVIYIPTGHGYSIVQQEGKLERRLDFQEGSLFSPPLNAYHGHYNGDAQQWVRYFVVTNMPLNQVVYGVGERKIYERFVFGSPFLFTERYNGEENYFSVNERLGPCRWKVNYVKDINEIPLDPSPERGAGARTMHLEMVGNTTVDVQISEIPPGGCQVAHQHIHEEIIHFFQGEGYTVIRRAGERERRKYLWHAGSLLSPPRNSVHQHFCTSREPARYLSIQTEKLMKAMGIEARQ
ncbi:MAG: cupin domain-containing protein [Deltaproteobacteria bacterium]|nr:cupin domain-containing protein [Deltaproteobacteria bacterium]